MKYFVAVFFALILLVSCNNTNSVVPENEVRVSGNLTAFPALEVSIVQDNPYDLDFETKVLSSIKLDSTGKFSMQFPLEKEIVAQFKLGNQVVIKTLYLFPGDDLKIVIDNSNPDDIKLKFEGKAAVSNNYNYNVNRFFPKNQEFEAQLEKTDLNSFNAWVDKRRQEMLDYYKDFFTTDTVPKFVNVNEISDINFQWAYLKNEWALRNYYYNQEVWSQKILPDNYWDFLRNINFNEPFLHVFLERYLESLAWQWHINQVSAGKSITTQEMEAARFEFAITKFTDETRDIAMAVCINNLLAYQFDERAVELVSTLLEKMRKEIKNKNYLSSLEAKFKKRLSLLKGNDAPDFSLPNLFKAPISLSDFKGKVVYMYFWSTLNPISTDLVPYINNIQMYFAGDTNIVFLSMALENNSLSKWRTFIETNRALGPQIYSEGDFTSKLALDYMINSLPAYVIVDKKGKIYDVTAPFPGDTALPNILRSLF